MRVIDLSAYRKNKWIENFQGQLREADDYYEYCFIPDYEMEFDEFKIDGIQVEDIFVNIVSFNSRTMMVSVSFPKTYDIHEIIEWLGNYKISFNEKDQTGYFAAGAAEIVEGIRYRGMPIVLCKRGKKKLYYDPSEFVEVTDHYQYFSRKVDTGKMKEIDLNAQKTSDEMTCDMLTEKDWFELDMQALGLDKDDVLDSTYTLSEDDWDEEDDGLNEDWEEKLARVSTLRVLDSEFSGNHLAVTVLADDPMELEGKGALNCAKEYAKDQGFNTFVEAEDIEVRGQNEPCRRVYHFTGDKKDIYAALVQKRKQCFICNGVLNPSQINEGVFDVHNHIGPWSAWHGDLDAKVMVIGQDWGDVGTFIRQEGKYNPIKDTNRNLVKLLESVGLTEEDPLFFTNVVLCLKEGDGLAAETKNDWYRNCGNKFLKPLIDLVQPKIVITLGEKAYKSLVNLYGLPNIKFKEAVERTAPFLIGKGIHYFPMYHCGRISLNRNRNWSLQLKDWERIKPFLK